MLLHSVKDFIIPTLSVLDTLGGEAGLAEIEEGFHKRYAQALDPSIDWDSVTANHKKPLWADYCGSRVAYHFLKPEGYIVVESHGARGSSWKLTDKGRLRLKEMT
jgi:hypothetical protein